MKAKVLKSFYDASTSRTYSKGALYEASESNSTKLVEEGFIEIIKQPKKKVVASKEE